MRGGRGVGTVAAAGLFVAADESEEELCTHSDQRRKKSTLKSDHTNQNETSQPEFDSLTLIG